jgi:NitT/TauT family transport system permease protein
VSSWPFYVFAAAVLLILVARKLRSPWPQWLLPAATVAIFVAAWHLMCDLKAYEVRRPDGSVRRIELFPTPWETLVSMGQPVTDGTLLRYAVASLYRVLMGFAIAAGLGIPIGLWAGWYSRAFQAINPLIQALRAISPIAWIALAILWFGARDPGAIFLVAYSAFFPIVTGTIAAVRTIPLAYVRAAKNFGLRGFELFRRVVLPACLPQILISLRIGMGIAWLVIVAAEMIGIESGLGYMILDARNASNLQRMCGSMVVIGLIGVALDQCMRTLERHERVRWGFPKGSQALRESVVQQAVRPHRSVAGSAR